MKPGVYVHLPFCAVHCSYCDFPITTRVSLDKQYYAALLKEIEMHPLQENADTLYFGGGTPSLTPAQFLSTVKDRFRLEKDAEVTLEANPDDMDRASIDAWIRLGITRLSAGVQSLEDPVLRKMLRRHSTVQSWEALHNARNAGVQSLNVDLIIGSPEQTVSGFCEGLNRLIDFCPQHFSLYLLEIHENTALQKQIRMGRVQPMQEEDQLECYSVATRTLQQAGYQHYEVSNFALSGYVSRHNLKYWTNAPYEAYGAGACSYIRSIRTTNIASVPEYIHAVKAGRLPVTSQIIEDKNTEMRNALIFGLRKTEGIDCAHFEQTYGVSPLALFEQNGSLYLSAGLLEVAGNRLRLTLSGMLLSNEILSDAI